MFHDKKKMFFEKTQSSKEGILAIASSLYRLPQAPASTQDLQPHRDAMVPKVESSLLRATQTR